MESQEVEKFSLLFPSGYEKNSHNEYAEEYKTAMKDLGYNHILAVMDTSKYYNSKLREVFSQITSEEKIIKYRLDIIEDLLTNADMAHMFEELIPMLEDLLNYNSVDNSREDAIYHINKLHELELYVDCIEKLYNYLNRPDVRINSEGLNKLKKFINETKQREAFAELEKNLSEISSGFRGVESISLGINLDAQLKPETAVLLSVNDEKYKSGDLLDRLLSLDFSKDKYHGISPLEVVVRGSGAEAEIQRNILQGSLNRCLNSIFKSTVRSFSPSIQKYKNENTGVLESLAKELFFYLGALKLIHTMEGLGLPMCKPELASKEKRVCRLRNLYSIKLALKMHSQNPKDTLNDKIVTNDIEFGEDGRIFVLTGPNQGGKTTFIQAVGLAQLLFQLGIYVPAEAAYMSPVDVIYTHFPVEESNTTFMGRLGEECSRLSDMINKISSFSLVLLNESLTSTTPSEGAYIAKEILLGLRFIGCRGIFATHFHELAQNLYATNSLIEGDSKIESLVAGISQSVYENEGKTDFYKRSYKITLGAPEGYSYARDIALKYGISIDNIKNVKKNK